MGRRTNDEEKSFSKDIFLFLYQLGEELMMKKKDEAYNGREGI